MKVKVNGQTIEVPEGSSVSVVNGTITINGKVWLSDVQLTHQIVVEASSCGTIKVDRGSVEVHGDIYGNVDAGSSVQCRDITGRVDAGGSVTCNGVGGDVDAGGSVTAKTIQGDVDAGGSVLTGR